MKNYIKNFGQFQRLNEEKGCSYGSDPSNSDFKIYTSSGSLMHTSKDGKCGDVTRKDCEKACKDGSMKKHTNGYQYCEGYPKK